MEENRKKTQELEEKLNVYLPKWPQMIVAGEKISEEQALEIIRRTDSFLTHELYANDWYYIQKAKKITRIPFMNDYESFKEYCEDYEKWYEKWKPLKTEYIRNSWISSSYLWGAHGWCHPDGKIAYAENVGKYPDAEDIYDDWKLIAENFPFLSIDIILMSGEQCEDNTYPVIGYKVRKASIEVVEEEKLESFYKSVSKKASTPLASTPEPLTVSISKRKESAISLDQLKIWSEKVFV